MECFYVNGMLHGEYAFYYENGQVGRKYSHVNCKLHGECIGFYGDGSVKWHLLYVNDKVLIDLTESPVRDEEKMLLSLQYGVEWF
jgi:antitoxin component YwqK of YwqJK toxin-antitoxin module